MNLPLKLYLIHTGYKLLFECRLSKPSEIVQLLIFADSVDFAILYICFYCIFATIST